MTWRKTISGLIVKKSSKKIGGIQLAFAWGFLSAYRLACKWRLSGKRSLSGFPSLAADDALVLAKQLGRQLAPNDLMGLGAHMIWT